MHLVPVVPSEVDQFFDTFRDMPIAQKQQQFKALRDIHHEYIADLESRKGQPEPMVTPIAHSLVKGTQGASSSSSGAPTTLQLELIIGLNSLVMVVTCMVDAVGATRKRLMFRGALLIFDRTWSLQSLLKTDGFISG